MKLTSISLFSLFASLLAGCALLPEAEQQSVPEQQCTYSPSGHVRTCMGTPQPNSGGARRQVTENERSRQLAAQIRSDADRQCAGYGFVSGTTPFAQCVMQIDTAQRSAMERQQQAERQRAQRYSQCKLEEAQMWFEPGSEGFGLGKVQRIQRRFEGCMAGLPPPPKIEVICSRISRDDVRCSSR
jgi:hypothetical protein